MKTLYFKSLWGMTGDLDSQLATAKAQGYDGVEWAMHGVCTPEVWKEMRGKHGLALIILLGGEDARSIIDQYHQVAAYEPMSLTVHTGRDSLTWDAGKALMRELLAAEKDLPFPVGHETHRGRLLYNPWTTRAYLEEFEDMKVVADFSHFVCVCERLLEDREGDLATIMTRAIHVHGRVGHEEGPQVSDPRAPEWAPHVERHFDWWTMMRKTARARGAETFTFTPEFGPPGYMQTLPFTRQPVADLLEVCLWMANQARERWGDPIPEKA